MVHTEGNAHPGPLARKKLLDSRSCDKHDKKNSDSRNRSKIIEYSMKEEVSHFGAVGKARASAQERSRLHKEPQEKLPETGDKVAAVKVRRSQRTSKPESIEQKGKPSVSGNERIRNEESVSNSRKQSAQKRSQSSEKKVTNSHGKNCKEADDGDDDHLDFSAIEQKIFEGFTVTKNSERRAASLTSAKQEVIRKSLPVSSKKKQKNVRSVKENDISDTKNELNKGSNMSKTNMKEKERKKMPSKVKSLEPSVSSKRKRSTAEISSKRKRSTTENNAMKSSARFKKKSTNPASDSDISDWEEVDEMEGVDEIKELLSESQETRPKQEGVQIELDAPDMLWGIRKRKKRTEEEMMEEYLRKSVNRSIKEVHENMHKAHLLCLFAHGRFVNMTLNSDTLLGAALSIIPEKNVYPPKRLDIKYLEKFVNWFSRKIAVNPEDMEDDYWSHSLKKVLMKRFEMKKACSNREFVFMFVVTCRALGMTVRLILSLQPMSWKPSAESLIKSLKKTEEKRNKVSEPSCSQESESCGSNLKRKIRKGEKDKFNRKMLSSDSDADVLGKKCSNVQNAKKKGKTIEKRKSLSEDDDSDFDPASVKVKKGPKLLSASRRRSSDKRKSIEGGNTDKRREKTKEGEVEGKRRKSEPLVEWAEVYVEEEEKWVCVDVTRGKFHCMAQIGARMPAGSAYITAYNANQTVKDVSRRYISSWLSSEKKLRCCSKWWEKALRPFKGQRTRIDKEEDKEMDQNLQEQPLPKNIGEYKNHPLYALQRHLLKFEAIYPPDVSPVGFIRSEPVYPRDSIYNLHSRDTWMKEAKTVRVDEQPYKIVKARPKWDKVTCKVIKDLPLELFGEWQVEDYEPPVASGGKVPRNEYGNVELFKPSMLPKGCVHIPINGLSRLARKLNIDCAPAMVGFDFHSGWTHPVYDGYVVCEEFKDTLMDAWNQEQIEQAKRAEEKRQKRIYDNWKRLIQGILVKERVREKYGNAPPSDEEEEKNQKEVAKKIIDVKENETTKKKIKQEDIDAVRPTIVTHQVRNLKIDLSSNVVEMAKKSRKRTMKTKNTVKRAVSKKEKKEKKTDEDVKTEGVDDSSVESESDQEEKKAKIRAILQWGNKAVTSNPDLSDDSDVEKDSKPMSSSLNIPLSNPFHNKIMKTIIDNQEKVKNRSRKRTKECQKQDLSDSEEDAGSASSSRSTTPEPDVRNINDVGPRRLSHRVTKHKIKTYKESGGESEGDISVDESDFEDKSYDPKDEKKKAASQTLSLSDGDDSN